MEEETKQENPEKQKRLCSEIQLFDLCDREKCEERDGRYCTNPEALAKFEAISEEDDAAEMYLSEELDDDAEADDEYDDDLGDDEYDDEDSDEKY